MKRATLLLLFLFPALACAQGMLIINSPAQEQPSSSPAPSSSLGVLRWTNGETLQGNIATASATGLSWKTPLFEDPLQLGWHVVDRIDWTVPSAPVTSLFSVSLRDGSFIYGDLVSITGDSMTIHSARHGDAVLQRSEVLNVRRLSHGSLLYSGPTGNVGWQIMANQPDGNVARNSSGSSFTPPLVTGPDGALMVRSWNRCAYLDLTLPDSIDAEFRVRSTKRPDFSISLGGNLHDPLRVETWDDELVLVDGDQFKPVRKIEKDEREVALRVCWDKKEQKCSVFTPTGELITTWEVPGKPSPSAPGLIVQNKGLDLALEFLRIRTWDGKSPAKIDSKQSHLELSDGRNVSGEILSAATGSIQVHVSGQDAPANFPLANVDALIFSSDPPQAASHEALLSYADGTLLMGRIASVTDGHADIATSFTKEPLQSKLDGLLQMRFDWPASGSAAPEPALTTLDKIVIQRTTLHGKLEGAGDNGLHWLPVGGTQSSRPSQTIPCEITRALPADAAPSGDPALFYLNSGDVLSGNLRSLDKSGAEFESSIMTASKLPANELAAIQFEAPTQMNVQGFGDAGWRILKGDDKSVRRDKDSLEMDPGTALAYPSLMESSEISFKYSSTVFSGTRLRLFCEGTDGTHSVNLLLGNTGNQFVAGLEAAEGQFQTQTQIKTKPNEPVSIRLVIGEKQIELFVNDLSLQKIPIDTSKQTGAGLIIEPASLWGNGVRPISLSDFSATSVPGRTWLPEVDADIKNQVLTVPRFQKDDPPRHVLLAANGDVLRGEVEAATDSHFGFRCGMENLNVPRDRVKAVIWLKPPDENPPAPTPAAPPTSSVLERNIQGRIIFRGSRLRNIIPFLAHQAGNLNIVLPQNDDATRQANVSFNNQTVGEALNQICDAFDLRYRVGSDGTIILESTTQPMVNFLTTKTYWIKPDFIPKSTSVQDALTAKGIAFPKETSAQWQPEAQLLTMTNTAENHTKLAALLASDTGWNLGSPTHWLLLTTGARLALAVDKFDRDFITGHNPIYGVCKIPMAQVYIIRTSAPEPTAVIRSLADWRLINAPEPVLPEGGGESSPSLGKDAATFKLPLLAGGDFDLNEEKGKVVVLDFWATWCGPCVKSLPGLIEAMSSFPTDKVKLIGLNQGESPAQVKHFMETRGLKFTVAMDSDQGVAQKYGVDAIPHTVIVGPDGKVAWVQTGYNPDGESEATDTVKRLLGTPSPAVPK